ncbi:MAG: tRNA pseudouridine(13) synthase TruD [Geobacteraceae bacterium]|nr:tRNA pseudouridine(13) synthase TruD [Geobacteraceae bacterium]
MHAYLTPELPGTGGVIKETPDDFAVTEIPLYLPQGDGEHTYAEIEKRGLTTLEAIRRLSRHLGIAEREIGYAGMKDARGVTRQTLSFPRVEPDRLLSVSLAGLRVLSAVRHRNKLKPGHLAGNRFTIKVRDVAENALEKAEAAVAVLAVRGVPNYFGLQRYGSLGNSHLIGREMVRGDFKAAVDALMGNPETIRDEQWRSAVEAYHRGDLPASMEMFPGHCRTEREIVARLLKRPEAHEKALESVSPRLKKLYLSAYQSYLFDRVLEKRLNTFDSVLKGDLAFRHDNGACFIVEDTAAEAERAGKFEISPSGPMFGCKMKLPEGAPLAIELDELNTEGISLDAFNLRGGLRMEGERRPLRAPLGDIAIETDDDGLLLRFSLPKGAYATSVLREIIKGNPAS